MLNSRRNHQEHAADWNQLPQDLIELILGQLAPLKGSSSSMASVRLISRSWHKAFQEFPWQEHLLVRSSIQMEKICRLIPRMVSLRVDSQRLGTIKLDPVSSLTHLTSLTLTGKAFHDHEDAKLEPCVELGYLPSSLKELRLHSVYADSGTFSSLHCPSLTNLSFSWEQNTEWEVAELLCCLPSLKELKCGDSQDQFCWRDEIYSVVFESLNHLTKLILCTAFLECPSWEEGASLSQSLLELHLVRVDLYDGWTDKGLVPLQRLEVLRLASCSLDPSIELRPLPLLRLLILDSSSSNFMQLAPSSLQSLEFNPGMHHIPAMPEMSGLTRLQLTRVADSSPFLRLQSSALQELAFIHCTGIDFLAGADLRNLRRLHIGGLRELREIPSRTELSEYVRVGSIVQSAPQLKQVSGSSRLISVGMRDTLRTWDMSECNAWQVSSSYGQGQGELIPLWIKP